MLKSFKNYIRESSDDEGQVLRDLLTNGLISRNEFYTLAKESGVHLDSEDYDLRYTITLSAFASNRHTTEEETLDHLAREVSAIDQTHVAYIVPGGAERVSYQSVDRRRRNLYILEIASNLDEEELSDELALRLDIRDRFYDDGILAREIELH
jgi:nanoRNase/pAp phosphatase (c-di-AMP/oligoRNAs hydrolase)